MLISLNWIRDFVNLDGLDPDKLIHQFSLSTAEVENDIFYKGQNLSGVVVAEIKSIEAHPDSKKLHLLKVDTGSRELTEVVCGAPIVRIGMKTAFATIGAQLGEIKITPRNLGGYTSYGMCCSEAELGISDDNSGIMELCPSAAVGTDIKDLFQIDDIIFEVDNKSLTNRPDLWGHYGIAREFAALTGRPLLKPQISDLTQYKDLPPVDLKIEDTLCRRYTALRFENISRHVSPMNMRIRLYYCGMRAINYLTDLTNYLMLELGQPMHAFDSRKLDKIRIKRFPAPFTFTTLDKVERKIDENTLMICNGDTPVAIAGIMGGLDSEIVADTSSLTLESANFDAVSVRKSSARLAHRTDASMRYEKSLDPEMTYQATARFVELLKQYDPGVRVTSSLTDSYVDKFPPITLDFDKAFVDRYTGIEISDDTIVKTLTALGFEVTLKSKHFTVKVPSWRATKDVTMKADIIEEITRIYGYDNFDVNTAISPIYPVRISPEKSVERQITDILVKRYSLHEVHSYIWAYTDEYKKLDIAVEPNVKLLNASNPNTETLRRSLIPTQLCQVKANTAYANQFGIFEIGRIVRGLKENGLCDEHKVLGITLFDKSGDTQGLYKKLLTMLSVLADDILHKKLTFARCESDHNYIHPMNYNVISMDGIDLGRIGTIHPQVGRKLDKKASVVFAELDIALFSKQSPASIAYEETSRFPSIDVDLTFLTPRFAPISEAIQQVQTKLIRKIAVTDLYEDEAGTAITVRMTFVHPERTLTKDEVMSIADQIISLLKEKGIALKA